MASPLTRFLPEALRRRRGEPHEPQSPRGRLITWRRVRFFLYFCILIAAVGFLAVDRSVVRRFERRTTSYPSRIFGAPYHIDRGGPVDTAGLRDRLLRLGYVEVPENPTEPGQFQQQGNDWVIFLNPAVMPGGKREPFPVELDVRRGKARRIRDLSSGGRLDGVSLEPETLFTFYDDLQEERRLSPLEKIPVFLQEAVVIVEDRRFRRHHGVDLTGIGRAFLANLRAGGVIQGGSTITQQLVKNLYGPGRRSIWRKILEAVGAVALERHYGKNVILEAYLNEVYLGQKGPVAISGVGDASRFYFGMDVHELDLPRSALLAGMIRNPGRYNPRVHPDEAAVRRNLVLRLMKKRNAIDEETFRTAIATPVEIGRKTRGPNRTPWIADYLAQEIRRIAPEAIPSRAGFSIFTTFDAKVQRAATEALRNGLDRLEQRLGKSGDEPLEGAVVVLRPSDGALLALVGGRDYARSQFNRAISSHRSPGSTFKPFVFVAGFERDLREPEFSFTAASVFEDAPLEIRSGGKIWNPTNYDREFRGRVSVREALENSINVPTVRAAMNVGLPTVVETARRCGIESRLEPIPSLALGTKEVTPLEMAAAYAAFANGGWRIVPHGLEGVVDGEGLPFGRLDNAPSRVLDPGVAYLVTDLLEGVMHRGTGRSSAGLGFTGHGAGKTGSSDGLRDGWFVGYTPNLLALVWVGHDDNRPLGAPGGVAALPIWVDLMKRLQVEGEESFRRPRAIVKVDVDPTTGQRAVWGCPRSEGEIFVSGTEPDRCEVHGGKRRRGFWRRLFSRERPADPPG